MIDEEGQVSSRAPILVTGSHRSGSTWVGRMLASAPGVGYISEPFHVRHPVGLCGADFAHWYTYICNENAANYRDHIAETLAFRYRIAREAQALPRAWLEGWRGRSARTHELSRRVGCWPELPLPHPGRRMLSDAASALRGRRRGARPLMKDPMALFSAPWLHAEFEMNVVVLVRHPAAFAASLKRLDWRFPFGDLVSQPLLMRDVLAPFATEITAYANLEQPLIDQAALLWRILHSTIRQYQSRFPSWVVIRHEDLSADPPERFNQLFEQLGLRWTEVAARTIERYSSPGNPRWAREGEVEFLMLDSRAASTSWRERLTDDEVNRVRELVGDISDSFYSGAEW